MIREFIFFTKFFHHLRDLSDLSTRNLRKEVVLYLFIEPTEELRRESTAHNISRSSSLEIDPCIFANF